MAEIKYEITEELAVLSESSRGWTKELNMVSWNDREPKFDIREWAPNHERMGKGVTLNREEMKKIKDILNEIDF
ncbi:MAG TPA: PC4/YdbC family ssDNA-binding protein [Sedimentibacter sp.]|nr:PC4/YdbC family ssDNA-binding protein [Sedimentibacter sp.]